MKKICFSLLCAGAMSISAGAFALPTQALFNAFVVKPTNNILVGQLRFSLDGDVPGQYCRYFYEWDNRATGSSAQGYMDEAKVQGNASCIINALTSFVTAVQNDPAFPSSGFDSLQQFSTVITLSLGESANGTMKGIILYGSPSLPSTMLNSFKIKLAQGG